MNVKHRQCAEAGCATRPAFNWRGEEKGIYCNKHKEKGMINVDKKDAAARPGRPPLQACLCVRSTCACMHQARGTGHGLPWRCPARSCLFLTGCCT